MATEKPDMGKPLVQINCWKKKVVTQKDVQECANAKKNGDEKT